MQTGQIVWADEWPHQCYGGVTVTKGGVVFAGTDEGEIKAYNAATGAELWHFEIGAGPSMISVYEYGSKERVSIYGGGNSDGDTKHGDYLWQFSLNGTGPAQKECQECIATGLPEKNPWPPAVRFPLWAGPITGARSRKSSGGVIWVGRPSPNGKGVPPRHRPASQSAKGGCTRCGPSRSDVWRRPRGQDCCFSSRGAAGAASAGTPAVLMRASGTSNRTPRRPGQFRCLRAGAPKSGA